jgi:hypothetical protein
MELFQPNKKLPQSEKEYEKDNHSGEQEFGCCEPFKDPAQFWRRHSGLLAVF